MDYEASTWDSYSDSDVFTSSTITNFGPNDSANTDLFWSTWYNNSSRTADIFIDQAPAFSGFNLQTENDTDALGDFNSGSTPINTVNGVTNWQPQGLSNGTYVETDWGSDDNMGQLTFSMIGGPTNPMWTGSNSYFKTKMQTHGTLFRFRDDPNQQVYRVFHSSQTIDGNNNDVIPAGPIDVVGIRNFDNDGSSPYVDRHTIIVRFQRLDNNNNGTNNGLDASVWDPRGTVKHNGLGSLTIDFVQRTQVQNLSEESISTNSACFETEPKEDVGLDIYYEASGAVPIRLNQKNIKTFTGSNTIKKSASLFAVNDRSISNNAFEQVSLTGEPYVYQTYGANNVHIKRDVDGSDVDLATIVTTTVGGTPDGNGGYVETTTNVSDGICAAIDDIVSFKNRNGLVTKSKILDHVKLSSGIAIPSDRNAVTAVSANLPLYGDGIIYGTIASVSQPFDTGTWIGKEITGTGIDKGTFVTEVLYSGQVLKLNKKVITSESASFTFITVTGYFEIEKEVWQYPVELGWFNCYSFGNGVESDRIRDDFNTPQINNGVKASSTFLEYGEETKGSSMIYSGLYNSTSSVNNLNQFNQAEKITKDLNTTYGSIQAMKTRDGDVVVFAEDKVIKVMSSGKDAVFNADNKPQLTATDAVLGTSMPFAGDYGISKNPESLAVDQYRMYFTDMQRGAVLRLSGNGITPISDVGMKTYFRENLKKCNNLIGSFDGVNDEYNITLDVASKWSLNTTTLSFSEGSKGWVSFKSFTPLTATSVADRYYSVNFNGVYQHYNDVASRNNFYGTQYNSEIEVLFNDSPSSVKSFRAVNYEGSQAKIDQFTTSSVEDAAGNSITANDGEYYNLSSKSGWYVDSITTDLQSGDINEFIEKENKWFNYIKGITTTLSNLDTSEITVQGIGFPLTNPTDTQTEQQVIVQAVDANGDPIT